MTHAHCYPTASRFSSLFVLFALWLTSAMAWAAPMSKPAPINFEEEVNIMLDDLATQIETRRDRTENHPVYNEHSRILVEDRTPVDVILRRTEALIEHLDQRGALSGKASDYQARLADLKEKAKALPDMKVEMELIDNKNQGKHHEGTVTNRDELLPVFAAAMTLQREVALRNPLLAELKDIAFVKRFPAAHAHMCDEWYGRCSVPGGGLYVIRDAFSPQPTLQDYVSETPVQNGQYEGETLKPGSFVTPEVSYDGQTIYFAFSGNTVDFSEYRRSDEYEKNEYYFNSPERAYHIFAINADGSNLRQVTHGTWNDFDPAELPNGRLVFLSERRGGEGRCHPRPCPSYVMCSMLPDGSDIQPLSFHEINEWSPTVTNDGRIIYSRWDYVDRSNSAGQHPWICHADGRDPRALYGQYEGGGSKVQADLRPVPESPLFFGTMYGHHHGSWGTLVVYDSRIVDDGTKNCWKYLTGDIPGYRGKEWRGAYATPFPLDETFFLTVYSPNASPNSLLAPYRKPPTPHGIYLMDKFGNKILVYRGEDIPCNGPFPLRPRKRPAPMPHKVANALPPGMEEPATNIPADEATVAVMNVYDSKLPWPEDRKIKALRIIHVLPKTTPWAARPPITYDGEFVARQVLGTVPVEEDGSAYFKMPASRSVYFQALDENGLAIQSMRSSTYAMPGEAMVCQGCHEPQNKAIKMTTAQMTPKALQRPPSELKPGPEGSKPMTFMRLVQPVLDARCVDCHEKNLDKTFSLKSDGEIMPKILNDKNWKYKKSFNASYANLRDYAWCYNERGGQRDGHWGSPGSGDKRTVPGEVGAYVSPLYNILTTGSHKDKVDLTDEDMERLVTWLDTMSVFYGAYEDTNAQKAGEIVQPTVQ